MQQQAQYETAVKLRKTENLHIVFWLFKDISWCLGLKILGVSMVVPTVFISVWLLIKNKKVVSEFCHNLAIVFWICANSFWMTSEFFGFENTPLLFGLTGKQTALIPFSLGLLCLVYYYFIWKPRHKSAGNTM